MTENGILMYDLAGNWCEECGRAKSYRLWPGVLTGCKTCDEVVTRHRCTKRPDLATGESWTCPDCGTLWTAAEEEETCGECGQGIGTMRRAWDSVPGDRLATAPRYVPRSYTPLRASFPPGLGLFPSSPDGPFFAPFREGGITPPRTTGCYQTASGMTVHVRPGCRCRR